MTEHDLESSSKLTAAFCYIFWSFFFFTCLLYKRNFYS
uniref:Uncharacterized protein n=1 Tax=Zea mays TaxID=4577 RepID=C4J2H6_MAIZE|nr:unknown [Zea mays]